MRSLNRNRDHKIEIEIKPDEIKISNCDLTLIFSDLVLIWFDLSLVIVDLILVSHSCNFSWCVASFLILVVIMMIMERK